MGNLIRTAHGFDAAFVFSLASQMSDGPVPDASPKSLPKSLTECRTDTSRTVGSVPYYEYDNLDQMILPKGCALVGVELSDEAVDIPSFRHPLNAAYILGSERLSVSDAVLARCDHVIKIPTKFSLNVATAGAIVMYDRLLCYGRFSERPVSASGEATPLPEHVQGGQLIRNRKKS